MSVRLYRLHYEILQFYQFMIPTDEEHAVRQQVINRISNVINQYLPTASVRKLIMIMKMFIFIIYIRLTSMVAIKRACICR
jgi:DNA polymerase sigma